MRKVIALGIVLMLSAGCSTYLRNRELERVAKDWSMVIRASQVIPIYPLTEDLQPGDMFLVQLPIDEQQKIYKQRGFLPLDNMIYRLDPNGYEAFYDRSFAAGSKTTPLPKYWLTPDGDAHPWSLAPNVGFPSYSFSVQSGGGFNLALPVQGVPIGLSLLGGGAAQGTVTIADARTYGVDTVSLYDDVRAWARGNREFLGYFAPSGKSQNYIRVVSRVYLAGRLNVSLQSSRSFGATASGGAPKPVDLVVPSAGPDPKRATLDAYNDNVGKLNTMLQEALKAVRAGGAEKLLPGGTVKVVAASSDSISLVETFNRPLVVGYLGFDILIDQDGILGPPIPTHAVLAEQLQPPASQLLSTAALRTSYEILVKQGQQGDPRAAALVEDLDKLEKLVPEKYPCAIVGFRSAAAELSVIHEAGSSVRGDMRGLPVVTTYRGELVGSIDKLRQTTGDLRKHLKANEEAFQALISALREHALLLNRATEYANQIEP
jgi:hypothetical protein